MTTKTLPKLENLGSLITYNDGGSDQCLGHLMNFAGHGVFDPTFGKVDVSEADANLHNAALDKAMVNGLDDNCEVGQCGTFYLSGTCSKPYITTFTGTIVSTDCTQHGRVVTFHRKGKTYRGRSGRDCDLLNFRRVK